MRSDHRRNFAARIARLGLAVVFLAASAHAAPVSMAKARKLIKSGEHAAAEEMLKQLLADRPDDGEVLFWLGRAAAGADHHALAQESLRAAAQAQPRSADAHYWLGFALERGGRLGEALEAYRKALSISSGHRLAAAGVGRLTVERPIRDRYPHHAVALEVEGGLSVDRRQARVESPQIHDYTFSRAPADWLMELGDWRVRSRWSCTPDWNFMGGESPQVAALWNKREFLGDITVEAYISYKMNVLGEGGYRNGTDFNLSICADGRNVSSGYSFIIGGWGNSWTRIMKGTEVLAETNAPSHKPVTLLDGQPGSWAWHRRWWEVRAVRRGEYLYLFFDNELVLQAHDPDPLPGGRVALWTFDNGIIIPRVKLYYENERPPAERGEPPYAPHVPVEDQPPAGPFLTFASESHPSIQSAFDHDLGGWTRRDGQHGALLSLDSLTADGQGRCLLLTNEYSGGTFGATAIADPFDAVKLSRLRFDYRAPETLKANIQLTAAGNRYEIIFTAPEFPSDRARRLAAILDVKKDLKWHHAELDLLGCLRRFHPDAESIEVSDLWFGLDTVRDYALAGFGANPALCEYRIDNFALIGAGPAEGQVQLALRPRVEGEAQPTVTFDCLVSDSALAKLDGQPEGSEGAIELAGLADGTHYLHARTVAEDGTVGPTYRHEIVVDLSPPIVAGVQPEAGAATSAEELTLTLADAGSGIDPASLALTINETPISADSPGLSFDPVTGEVLVLPARAGISFAPGDKVAVVLESAADWLGNSLAEPQSWTFTYDQELDETPPTVPTVQLPRAPLCFDTFEDSLGTWHNRSEGVPAALTLDNSTAASGRRSLRVYNPASGGGLGAVARAEPFDAGVYRLVSFDYKLRPEVRIDLYAVVGSTGYTVELTNNDGVNKMGTFADVQADDQWHHAEVNLYELLRAAAPSAPGYVVTELMFIDAGSYGNIQHQHYNIDNFALLPVMSVKDGDGLRVAATDPSGIAGLSYLLDTDPATEPPTSSVSGAGRITLPPLPGAEAWLHTKAVDEAGNWSAASHDRLLVDSQAPSASAVSPENGAATAVSSILLSIGDSGIAGVDPRSIELEVGGTTYTVEDSGLTYDSSSRQLTWHCEQTSNAPVVFANGQQVPVRLLSAADYAGNPVPSLPSWAWTMDYSQDTSAPAVATLSSSTHSTALAHRFEGTTHQVQKYGSKSSATVALDDSSADGAGHSAKITNATAGGNMAFYVVTSNIDTSTYPYLSFDYRIPAGVTLDMLVYFYNESLWFQFNGSAGGYQATIPDIVADGQWHRCSYNLYQPISQRASQRGIGSYYTTSYIAFVHRDNAALPAGVEVNIDNVVASAAGPNATTLSWSTTDTTGIAGYSYLIDQSPNTEPPTTPQGAEVRAQFADRPSGINWFHVRAVDGAGNWGPANHHAIHVK